MSILEIFFGLGIAVNLFLNIVSQNTHAILGWTAAGIALLYGLL